MSISLSQQSASQDFSKTQIKGNEKKGNLVKTMGLYGFRKRAFNDDIWGIIRGWTKNRTVCLRALEDSEVQSKNPDSSKDESSFLPQQEEEEDLNGGAYLRDYSKGGSSRFNFVFKSKEEIQVYIKGLEATRQNCTPADIAGKMVGNRLVKTDAGLIKLAMDSMDNSKVAQPGFRQLSKNVGCDYKRLERLFPLGLVRLGVLVPRIVEQTVKQLEPLAKPLFEKNAKGEISIQDILKTLGCKREMLSKLEKSLGQVAPLQPVYRDLNQALQGLLWQAPSKAREIRVKNAIKNAETRGEGYSFNENSSINDETKENSSISQEITKKPEYYCQVCGITEHNGYPIQIILKKRWIMFSQEGQLLIAHSFYGQYAQIVMRTQ